MPMNPIKIPNNFINNSYQELYDYCVEFIKQDKELIFKIKPSNILSILDQIDSNYKKSDDSKKNFLYFLYKYVKNNDISNPLNYSDGGKPKLGFEFLNKESNFGYGIFHCHLSEINQSILIWYPIILNKGWYIQLNYLPYHPTNFEYENIVKNIYYKNDSGFHYNESDIFFNLKNLLPNDLYENKILNFNEFIKKLII